MTPIVSIHRTQRWTTVPAGGRLICQRYDVSTSGRDWFVGVWIVTHVACHWDSIYTSCLIPHHIRHSSACSSILPARSHCTPASAFQQTVIHRPHKKIGLQGNRRYQTPPPVPCMVSQAICEHDVIHKSGSTCNVSQRMMSLREIWHDDAEHLSSTSPVKKV